jgi:hypothetical protein
MARLAAPARELGRVVAGDQGIEPRTSALETDVLPLHQSPPQSGQIDLALAR